MDFTQRKLPREAFDALWRTPVSMIQPYALMTAPVYVYLRKNEKFLAIKGPLDFFTTAEIERIRELDSVYLHKFFEVSEPFQQAARSVRALLTLSQSADASQKPIPPGYEISDGVLQLVGPLWGKKAVIEPFFIAIFVDTLCDPLSSDLMISVREKSIADFEKAMLLSSWAVFIALHIGLCELTYLNNLRARVIEEVLTGQSPEHDYSETDEVIRLALDTLPQQKIQVIEANMLGKRASRLAGKLAGRLDRIVSELVGPRTPSASVYGKGGLIDV